MTRTTTTSSVRANIIFYCIILYFERREFHSREYTREAFSRSPLDGWFSLVTVLTVFSAVYTKIFIYTRVKNFRKSARTEIVLENKCSNPRGKRIRYTDNLYNYIYINNISFIIIIALRTGAGKIILCSANYRRRLRRSMAILTLTEKKKNRPGSWWSFRLYWTVASRVHVPRAKTMRARQFVVVVVMCCTLRRCTRSLRRLNCERSTTGHNHHLVSEMSITQRRYKPL